MIAMDTSGMAGEATFARFRYEPLEP